MANPVLIGWQTQITMSPAEAPPPLEQFIGWQMVIPPTMDDQFPLQGESPPAGALIPEGLVQ